MKTIFGHDNDLPQKCSAMYRMLQKIASDKEPWTLGEVRRLLSRITPRKTTEGECE